MDTEITPLSQSPFFFFFGPHSAAYQMTVRFLMQFENGLSSRFANDWLFLFGFSSSLFNKSCYLACGERAASQDTRLNSQEGSRPVNSSSHEMLRAIFSITYKILIQDNMAQDKMHCIHAQK